MAKETLAVPDTINASPAVTGGRRSQRQLFTVRSAPIVSDFVSAPLQLLQDLRVI